ncbi:hypothetical protein E2562_018632 [Oryza meyeriana var. granulata]|uniref:Uncharacterized protein n=1 Tax=Oryza meyeriana var. granulata TaxID=110450 RepID=A0A6G1BYJ2_9ORYZ|nr:hypothetical protein E2562_018632 [Oryza meyeriana var. granulata]
MATANRLPARGLRSRSSQDAIVAERSLILGLAHECGWRLRSTWADNNEELELGDGLGGGRGSSLYDVMGHHIV